MSLLSDLLRQRKEKLESLQREMNSRQGRYPEGTLRISKCGGSAQYYYREKTSDRAGRYLTKNMRDLAFLLAQKDYDKRIASAAEQEIHAISAYLDLVPATEPELIYTGLSEERQKLITPILEPDEVFAEKWISLPYQGLGFAEDFPELLTDRGERVRSKSEVIIANLMAKEEILYRYEYPVLLNGFGTVHPDFTALNLRLRKEFYWEHLGMMDDPEYAEKAIRKISAYIRNGIFPGEQLILTAETKNNPINIREVRELIRHYLK